MNLRYKVSRHLKFNMHGAFGYGTWNWLLVLYRNGFKIDLLALPKVVWITLSILSTNVFRIYEDIRFRKQVNEVTIKDPIFILGYPRSGTTLLHYLLCKDSKFGYSATYQVLMPNLFLSMGGFLRSFLRSVLPKTRLMDNVKMATDLPKEEEFAMSCISDASMINGFYFPKNINNYFKKYVLFSEDEKCEIEWKKKYLFFLKKVSFAHSNKRLILKSPFNTGRIKQLLELFPEAKFITIHRNPYEVYYSNEKLYENILTALAFHETDEQHIENFIIESYKKTYEKYFEEVPLIPKRNLVTISYESLTNDPITTIKKVYDQLEIGKFEEAKSAIANELDSNKNYITNSYVEDQERNEVIRQEWKMVFKNFGYGESEKIKKDPTLLGVV